MISRIIYSLSFKMIYIVYLGQKRVGGPPAPPPPLSKSATGFNVRKRRSFIENKATLAFFYVILWLINA